MLKSSAAFLIKFCLCFAALVALNFCALSQQSYKDSIESYQLSYVKNHGVVKADDQRFLRFFPVDEKYLVSARVERIYDSPWFKMETSGKEKKVYRVYAILHFSINDTIVKLHVYQSQSLMSTKDYAEHLFIPFTDLTTGEESYENGRYIDLRINDLEPGTYTIDFNKAYNPYCAYVSDQFNCPMPPRENAMPVSVRAGEMKYGKEQ